MLSMHLRQLFRKPTRTALYLAVLILLTAFFCTSLNLYKDSQYNLQLADNAYTTIAVIELCADVNRPYLARSSYFLTLGALIIGSKSYP